MSRWGTYNIYFLNYNKKILPINGVEFNLMVKLPRYEEIKFKSPTMNVNI